MATHVHPTAKGTTPRLLLAAALGASLLLAGCGGSSSSGENAKADTAATASNAPSDSSPSNDKGSGALPDPCSLVPIAVAEKILGGPAAPPEADTGSSGAPACSWHLKQDPNSTDLSAAGHVLTLTLLKSPSPSMSNEQFFDAAAKAKTGDADVCDKAFWMNGILNAYKNGVYLSATAGLASDSPEAKQAATDLITEACKSL